MTVATVALLGAFRGQENPAEEVALILTRRGWASRTRVDRWFLKPRTLVVVPCPFHFLSSQEVRSLRVSE